MIEIYDIKLIAKIRNKGKLTSRSQTFELSGSFDGCYIFENELYDCRISWGNLRVFKLEKKDLEIGYPDVENQYHKNSRIKYTSQIYDELLK